MAASIHCQIPLSRRLAASGIFVLQHVFPKSARLEAARRKNVERILRKMPAGKTLAVERRRDLTPAEFVRGYLNAGLPVIFDGGASAWECTRSWSLDYFASRFADEEFPLVETTGLVEAGHDRTAGKDRPVLTGRLTARQFVDAVRGGEKPYLRFCPIMETHPELSEHLDQGWLQSFRRCFLGVSYQTFIGPAGRTTPLHSETTAFFYIQADGEKTWRLFSPAALALINPAPDGRGYNFSRVKVTSPDLERYPGFDRLTRYECHLKKGDILFVPAWMWHEVENSTEGWALSYRFTSLRGFFRFPAFVFIRLFLTRPSFLEIFYYSFFRKDIDRRDKNLLTPRIFLKG
ncbi:MAG TPA: cupin-like domain-containing protein [Bdellovibrionota bacterium]|nr:cupin-like domain-containing protein [Bdellovibrionota bacterium]